MLSQSLNAEALSKRARFCRQLVNEAGSLALAGFRCRATVEIGRKGPQDFLTETDTAVERHLREKIADSFPDDGFLGEETGGAPQSDALWVVDPIDGTANFARGIAHFCISIGFCYRGVTEFGCIHAPATGETWFAQQGGGAQLNGAPIHVADTADFAAACLELGWSVRRPRAAYLDALTRLLDAGANVRRAASGALALAYVADGRSDGYAEAHMNPWDCIAGLLIAAEAGARVSATGPAMLLSGGPVLAVTPALAAEVSRATRIALLPQQATAAPTR